MVSDGDGEKKPTKEEKLEAKNKKELFPRGRHEQRRKKKTVVEVKEPNETQSPSSSSF